MHRVRAVVMYKTGFSGRYWEMPVHYFLNCTSVLPYRHPCTIAVCLNLQEMRASRGQPAGTAKP
jgi:hypothetical protein